MRIFIGYPPTVTRFKGTPLLSQNRQYQVFHVHTTLFPVVLATGATMLRDKGHEVTWVDSIAEKLSPSDFDKLLEEKKPEILFFETKAPVVKIHWDTINRLKEKFPDMKICVMGDHVSALDLELGLQKEFMENCKVDFIINGGYFDFAFCELVEALEKGNKIPQGIWYKENGKVVENGRYNFTGNLDDAPIIDRVFTKNHLYQHEFNLIGRPLAYIMAGRDCWYGKCTFCFHPETNIMTKSGIKEIKDIKLGEEILTHNGQYHKNNFIFQRYYSGDLIVIKSELNDINCTPNHKLFVIKKGENKRKFIESQELEIGDLLTSHVKKECIFNLQIKSNVLFLETKIELNKANEFSTFPIKEIKKEEYYGDVYNLSVENIHSYTANLIGAANCVWDTNLYPKGQFRGRSPENVMKEVKYLVDEIGVKEIFDDAGTIIVGPWLKKFCNLMIESGYNKKVIYSGNMRFGAVTAEDYKLMKEAGFRLLKYGLESGVQSTINKLDKGTKIEEVEKSCREAKAAGLTVHLTMMCGAPWETKADGLETYKLAKKLMLKGFVDVLQSTVIIPYPGTPLYKEGMEKNWFLFDPRNYERFDMREPVFKTPDMTPQEVIKLNNKIYHIFLDPRYVLKHLKKIKNFDDVLYTIRGAKAVVGHLMDFNSSTAPKIEEAPIR